MQTLYFYTLMFFCESFEDTFLGTSIIHDLAYQLIYGFIDKPLLFFLLENIGILLLAQQMTFEYRGEFRCTLLPRQSTFSLVSSQLMTMSYPLFKFNLSLIFTQEENNLEFSILNHIPPNKDKFDFLGQKLGCPFCKRFCTYTRATFLLPKNRYI